MAARRRTEVGDSHERVGVVVVISFSLDRSVFGVRVNRSVTAFTIGFNGFFVDERIEQLRAVDSAVKLEVPKVLRASLTCC